MRLPPPRRVVYIHTTITPATAPDPGSGMLQTPTRDILHELNDTTHRMPSPPKRPFATSSAIHYPTPSTSALPKEKHPRHHRILPSESVVESEEEEEEEEEEEGGMEGDEEPKAHCSQCKVDLPLHQFPIRLATLTPFQVCKNHQWYWPEKKKMSHWAPDETSELDEVCVDVATRLVGPATVDTWIVQGDESLRDTIVGRIAEVGDWSTQILRVRKSRATTGPPPPQTYHYILKPKPTQSDPSPPDLRLSITHHKACDKFVLTLRTDGPNPERLAWRQMKKKKGKEAVGSVESKPRPRQAGWKPPAGASGPKKKKARKSLDTVGTSADEAEVEAGQQLQRSLEADARLLDTAFQDQPLLQFNSISAISEPTVTTPRPFSPTRYIATTPTSGLTFPLDPLLATAALNPPRASRQPRHLSDSTSNPFRTSTTPHRAPMISHPFLPEQINACRPLNAFASSHLLPYDGVRPLSLADLLASPFLGSPPLPVRTQKRNVEEIETEDLEEEEEETEFEEEFMPDYDDGQEDSEEDEESEESEDEDLENGGDWLTGFVRKQLNGPEGKAPESDEVDELESVGSGGEED